MPFRFTRFNGLQSRRLLRRATPLLLVAALAGCASSPSSHPTRGGVGGVYDVHAFGAMGDGKTLDTDALNKAIAAAHAGGGGTVRLPAGTYLCFSVHLQSNVTLYLEQGATLRAAKAPDEGAAGPTYDPPEPNAWDKYQDFGHTHWHNSLIWGEGLENVAIEGPGRIDGTNALVRGGNGRKKPAATKPAAAAAAATTGDDADATTKPATMASDAEATDDENAAATRPAAAAAAAAAAAKPEKPEPTYPNPGDTVRTGLANKSIALKLCRNVTLRDFSVLAGGHFAILATGVDNLTITGVKLDTNRDGMDLVSCRNVRVSDCTVNSPFDDGICLKADYSLGYPSPCEDVTVTNCQVSGYAVGSVLDATFKPFVDNKGKRGNPTGRIKLGTESTGDFRNITISNCVFDHCRGLALETVDGSHLEDVTVTNLAMRDVANSPIFIRLGARMRAPAGTPVGTVRRVTISNVVASGVDRNYGSILSGIPGHPIEDVKLSHVQILYRGGGRPKWATTQLAEKENRYPEPSMFGQTPAYAFFLRHVRGIEINDVRVGYETDDPRAPFVLNDVSDVDFDGVKAQRPPGRPVFVLEKVTDMNVRRCEGIDDARLPSADRQNLGGTEPSPAVAPVSADPAAR